MLKVETCGRTSRASCIHIYRASSLPHASYFPHASCTRNYRALREVERGQFSVLVVNLRSVSSLWGVSNLWVTFYNRLVTRSRTHYSGLSNTCMLFSIITI